ncbi:MAG TPA: thioredoxin domain-containing protein [Polyangiaceae bacterium]|nr:MAG: Disulfide bond formation protein D precursor [Deltaproteobacteria bacterium ADurb.Bin207]HOD25083.1 thioredoxin domain-containing protein [Polyangiaceae bacterium]HOR37196.1 thioredoxin domain-containing protein [Polyangiaceae bacterium]HPK95322.1 thioredoxin domain-containing protein [Polyangiaceae bacterium]
MRVRWLIPWLAIFACGGPPSATTPSSSTPATERPSDLTSDELRSYDAYLERFRSPCDNNQSLASCLSSARSCSSCRAAAQFVARSIRSGYTAKQVQARYQARFDPALVQIIDVRGAPSLGPDDAPVTIVEFADFQCPFCAVSAPLLDALVELYTPHLRLVFKDFPIKYHPNALSTAQAGVAAHNQGKFWQLHHLMFANREQLDPPDIERYARSLNLDMQRFVSDWESAATTQRVDADYQEGIRLNVRGTPSFFINGRSFDIELFDFGGEDLLAWIELEIELTTGKPYQK